VTKIHLETFGVGKPIVLVHGWAMHTGIWREFAKQLAQNYRVTCIDLPGHGRSEKIDPFTLERISDELVNIIPPNPPFSKGGNEHASCQIEGNGQAPPFEKGAGGICWLGWSLGATVVLDIADRYPERVSSLVLLAGNPSYTQTEQWPGMDTGLLDDFAGHLNKNCQATLLRFLSLQVNGLPDRKILLKALKESVFECDAPDGNTLQGGLKILKEAGFSRADYSCLGHLRRPGCLGSRGCGSKNATVIAKLGIKCNRQGRACAVFIAQPGDAGDYFPIYG